MSKKHHRSERPERTEPSSDSRWRRLLPKDPWQVVLGPIVVALVVAGVTAIAHGHGDAKAPRLQALAPVVVNPEARFESVKLRSGRFKGLDASRQTDGSKPRIEVRLHNMGTARSVLTSAVFHVRRFAIIPGCGRGAGLEVSGRYDVTLPDRAGASVEVPIDQQLGPDEADRFVFRLAVDHAMSRHPGQDLFFEVDVGVRHDNASAPLDVGRVVVALAAAPGPDDARYFSVPGATTCVTTPPPDQLAPTTFAGARSPQVDAFLRALRRAGA